MGEKQNLYNPHQGLTGRDGGPYLDDEERRLAEIVRAKVEKREPDFDNAPATAGTPLVTAATLVNIANPASNPSQQAADPYAMAVDYLAKDEAFPVEAFSERVKTEDELTGEKAAKDNDPQSNPANPTVISKDENHVNKPKADKPKVKANPAKKAEPAKAVKSGEQPATSKSTSSAMTEPVGTSK